MNHFLDIHKTDAKALRSMIDNARTMKEARQGRPRGAPDDEQPLENRMVALIFEKPSTRTRVSFDVGTRQMGGQTMVLSGQDMQLGHGETIADTARVLSRYVDLIMIRTFDESVLTEMAEHADVPVINGLTDRTHPCQIMADVLTFEEHRGPIKGKTLAWTGDGNNVLHSLIEGAGQFGYRLQIATPEGSEPDTRFVEWARAKGAEIDISTDPDRAATGADCIITDTWVSMNQEHRARGQNVFQPYQVNEALMAKANDDALFMHCLPAHRGEEVTDEVMDGPRSVVFDEAENRLHAQKAIMRWCMGVL
jgi:ornithine carbamoyltransferase